MLKEVIRLESESGKTVDMTVRTLADRDTWGNPSQPTLCRAASSHTVQLLEEESYEYSLEATESGAAIEIEFLEPSEIFSRSSINPGQGRIEAARYTGFVDLKLETKDGECFFGHLEICPRKLGYTEEYRWMLDRIAQESAELALLPFAAARLGSLSSDAADSAESLYQQFEFLKERLTSPAFESAVEQLRHRPHTEFRALSEEVPQGKPVRGDRRLAQNLTKPGCRVPTRRSVGRLDTLPSVIRKVGYQESFETVPNQFVRFVVEHWTALVDKVAMAVKSWGQDKEARRRRAESEISDIRSLLEGLERLPAIRNMAPLAVFPSSNTVLRSRSGYREFLDAFLLTQAIASLSWEEDDESFSAAQRSVSDLYECWVFLEVLRIVASIPGFNVDRKPLLKSTSHGLSLGLSGSSEVLLISRGMLHGREVTLELCFNRTFAKERNIDSDGSWTVKMRPDVSISIEVDTPHSYGKTWLHFDAKYKLHGSSVGQSTAKSEDIRKMHAYRDAIRRSAGAYVIYPGSSSNTTKYNQYHEIVPGVGAFAMRPGENGEAVEPDEEFSLKSLICDVVGCAVSQGTSYSRSRFWDSKINMQEGFRSPFRSFLKRPPDDTPVLLGYIKGVEHLLAVESLMMYNIRAEPERTGSANLRSEELSAEILVMYGQNNVRIVQLTGEVLILRKHDLAVEQYVPAGDLYFGLRFQSPDLVVHNLFEQNLMDYHESTGLPLGSPAVISWGEFERRVINPG